MRVTASYLGVIAIWSTTPLTIKWSGEGPGFLFGVTARMAVGTLLCLILLFLFRTRFPWDAPARRTYLAAGLAIYGAMLSVYWSAQFIPSGWISVIFGLTPLVTAALATLALLERGLTPTRILGMLLGVAGLGVIFARGASLHVEVLYGSAGVLFAVLLHSISNVWVKRIGASLPALAITAGGLSIALPLYLLTWWAFDGQWPESLPPRALGSILYLGVFGSVLGFFMYYYALRHVEASRMALTTLVTPVLALLLGQTLNGEPVDATVWAGAGLILLGLVVHHWGGLWLRGLSRQRP